MVRVFGALNAPVSCRTLPFLGAELRWNLSIFELQTSYESENVASTVGRNASPQFLLRGSVEFWMTKKECESCWDLFKWDVMLAMLCHWTKPNQLCCCRNIIDIEAIVVHCTFSPWSCVVWAIIDCSKNRFKRNNSRFESYWTTCTSRKPGNPVNCFV